MSLLEAPANRRPKINDAAVLLKIDPLRVLEEIDSLLHKMNPSTLFSFKSGRMHDSERDKLVSVAGKSLLVSQVLCNRLE